MSLSFSGFVPFSLLVGTATIALVINQPVATAAKSPQEIAQIAVPVTVQINPETGGGGSGIIFKREGNNYYVLTCIHVLEQRPGFNRPGLSVRTHDGQTYQLTNPQKLGTVESSDLGVVRFSSSVDYPVVKLANSDQAVIGSQVFVFGYPGINGKLNTDREPEFVTGFVTSRPSIGSPKGFEPYTLRYNATTWGGMSGGPVFDVDGRVIGIHGQGIRAQVAQGEQLEKTGINAAVPINTFIALQHSGQSAAKVAVDNSPSTDQPAQRLNNPQSASDFVAKGAVVSEQGNNSQAIEAYSQAIDREPNHAEAYYQRANARYDQGDLPGAIADYTKVIDINPEHVVAYYQRGVSRYNQGDQQGALVDFDRYISFVPDDIDGYYSRGITRRALGDLKGTFADFDQTVQLAPDDAKAYYNRGLARAGLKDLPGTLADFERAISLDPSWTVAYNTRAMYRHRLGDKQGAIADLSQIITLDPKNAIAYFNRGLVYRDLGDKTGAIADLQVAADLFQQQGDKNNYDKAREKLQRIQASLNNSEAQQPEPDVNSSQ